MNSLNLKLRRAVVSAFVGCVLSTTFFGVADAHDTTGYCDEEFDSNFAIENQYRNYRAGFMIWSTLDENGDVAPCPAGEYPSVGGGVDWTDLDYQTNCWLWRRQCGGQYIRFEVNDFEGHTWFEEWGVPPEPLDFFEDLCEPDDGLGAGWVPPGGGYSPPDCWDWTQGDLFTVRGHEAETDVILWVEHFQDHEPVIFDLEAIQVHEAPTIINIKIGPGEDDWFVQDPIPPNDPVAGSPGEYEYWDVSAWGFEVERVVMQAAVPGQQVAFGGFRYRTPSYSGWGGINVCGNNICSTTEDCGSCPEDCGECGVDEALYLAASTTNCTGAGNCSMEQWGIDLNGDTGYQWIVAGGTGGVADLYLEVAVNTGTRAMGLFVNGVEVDVISSTATQSPRPEGSEFGPFTITLNPGNNTVELMDNQGTEELDVHFLRVESELGFCGNNVCSSTEDCGSCTVDCGACAVPQQFLLAQNVTSCTGSGSCSSQSWGIDLDSDAGYQWTVAGGTGGDTELFVKVAVPSGARAMGLLVNGSQVGIVSTDSSESPRPSGKEFGPFAVTLNPGSNTVELVDDQGTQEFDVHYLRVDDGVEGPNPCASFCSGPVEMTWEGSYQSGPLGPGAVCRETTQPVAGGNCGNFATGRKLFLNGVEMPCDTGNWTSLPPAENGGYCVETTAGDYSWAYLTLW